MKNQGGSVIGSKPQEKDIIIGSKISFLNYGESNSLKKIINIEGCKNATKNFVDNILESVTHFFNNK